MFGTLRVLLASLTITAAAYGQAAAINGQIIGTITDVSGAPVPQAKVTAVNTQTGYRQTSDTTSEGLYRLPVLPLGAYEVEVQATGFSAYRQTGVPLSAGATVTIDATMQVQGVSTEVVVSGASPVVDPSRTDQGATLSTNAVLNLPLVSRNPFNFILQQPNVSGRGNTEFGVPRKVNANGFNGRINYQLDGSNNVQSDRAGIRLMPISQTWVQEIQSVNNGFAPEFGNTVGTVFNTVTRSGANDYHGDAAYYFRRTPMSARPALLGANRPTPEVNVDGGFANAGGRIVKDKVFFFGGYERVKRDLPSPVSVPAATIAQLGLPSSFGDAVPFGQNVTFFIGKVDWQLGSSNRLSLRYNGHRNDSPYNSATIGGLFLIDRSYNFVDRSHAGAVQLVSILSSNAVNEFRFQTPYRSQRQDRQEGVTGTGPAITIPGVANFGNSLNTGFVFEEMTPEFTDNFSWTRGSHAIKLGGSMRAIRDTQVQQTSANYTFPSVAAYLAAKSGSAPRGYTNFAQTLGDPAISYNSLFSGLYAQDSWKPRSNITLTYGVRYDVYTPPNANAASPFPFSKSFRTDKNNFAPRLGIAVGLGKTVLRASGGVFYDPFQTDMYRKAILLNGTPAIFSLNTGPGAPFAPAFPNIFSGTPQGFTLATQAVTTVSPDFATLYSSNANISLSRQLGRDLSLTATYLYTRGNRLPVFTNINLVPSGRLLPDGRPIFGTGRVYSGFGDILSAESVGQSTYNGLNVTLVKRYNYGLELFGTYTWSHAIDDAPEQNNIDSGDAGLSDPTNRRRDRGNSLTDRRHVFNGNFLYQPTLATDSRVLRYLVNNNRLAVLANIQSGEVINIGSNMVLNGDAQTTAPFQRPFAIGRNTLRVPRTSEFNARYSRLFPVRESMRFEFFAETTNVFNRTNVTGLNSTASVNNLGIITTNPSLAWTSALDQRLIQLGLKFNF